MLHRDNWRPGMSWALAGALQHFKEGPGAWGQGWGRAPVCPGPGDINCSDLLFPSTPPFIYLFIFVCLQSTSQIPSSQSIYFPAPWPTRGTFCVLTFYNQNGPTKHSTKQRLFLSEEFSHQLLLLSPSNIDLNFSPHIIPFYRDYKNVNLFCFVYSTDCINVK